MTTPTRDALTSRRSPWRRGMTWSLRLSGLTWAGAVLLTLATGGAFARGYERGNDPADRHEMGQDRREMRQDRREIRQDMRDLRRDQADVRRLARLIVRLEHAKDDHNYREEQRLRTRIHAMLRQETADARHDLAKDRAESRRSVNETRDLRDNTRDLRDDRRDLRDDRRDTAASRQRLARLLALRERLFEIEPGVRRGDRAALREEDRIFGEFLEIAREDARANRWELKEDRGELREDGRETGYDWQRMH